MDRIETTASGFTQRVGTFAYSYLRGLLISVWAFTFGVFSRRGREVIHHVNVITYRLANVGNVQNSSPDPNPVLPLIEPSLILDDKLEVQIREPIAAVGNVTLHELIVINKVVKQFKPRCLFEIGTFDGRTTLNIAANVPHSSSIYTLDLPKELVDRTALAIDPKDPQYIKKGESGSRISGKEIESKVVQLFGDSANFDFGPYENDVDFVFVDGAHSYEYVLNDSTIAMRLLREGNGIILWHDYATPHWHGVTVALNELYLNDPRFRGVKHLANTSLAYLCVGKNVHP